MAELDNVADEAANDDLHSSISAAFDEADEIPAQSESAQRTRDEQGRFAKSENTEAPKQTNQGAAQTGTGEPAIRRMPASWSRDDEALWQNLSPAIQDKILKRETDYSKGIEEKATKLKPWESIEGLLAPQIASLQMQGLSVPQLVERLVTAHTMLSNPQTRAQAYQYLYQQFPPPQFLNQPSQQYQPQRDPYLERINAIETSLRQKEETALVSHLESFAKDHPHFEDAAPQILELIERGIAKGNTPHEKLADAYEQAIWLNPSVREKVISDQTRGQAAQNSSQAAKAKKAASSLTGAPTGAAPNRDTPRSSLREELEAAFDNL